MFPQYTYLSDDEKVRYESHNCMRGSDRTVQIFYNNCVEIGRIKEYEQSSQDQTIDTNVKGFYDKFSFVNHSCGGNCAVNFTAGDGLQLVAARRILKGEEITVNYLDPYILRGELGFLRAQRQATLRRCWGFRCACEVCGLSGRQLRNNEAIKRTIMAYVKKQEVFADVQEGQNARNMFSLEVAILGEMGKLEREVLREVPECLVRCYRWVAAECPCPAAQVREAGAGAGHGAGGGARPVPAGGPAAGQRARPHPRPLAGLARGHRRCLAPQGHCPHRGAAEAEPLQLLPAILP
jgi:hypothetical protein